jgi:hypothetical protein
MANQTRMKSSWAYQANETVLCVRSLQDVDGDPFELCNGEELDLAALLPVPGHLEQGIERPQRWTCVTAACRKSGIGLRTFSV